MNRGLCLSNLVVTGQAGLIVTRMDLRIEPGQTVALVGESGSGKSMTAKAMTGLLPRGVTATGTLQLDDIEVDLALGPQVLTDLRGKHISLLLQNPFTSLSPVHRCGEQITAALISHMVSLLKDYAQHGFGTWQQQWQQCDALYGQEVEVLGLADVVVGIAQGINSTGALIINTATGQHIISGGEVTLRKKEKN